MKRLIEVTLKQWKAKENRKPLLVNGIRQVGKTWSVKDFGERYFKDLVYLNFDLEPEFAGIFKKSKDPKKILFELSVLFDKDIDPAETLIFFDEIQECNEALNSLKYFDESDYDYYVIGAGSYLGITLSKGASFPVGKVDMIELKPMTYKEFLLASGQKRLVEFIEGIDRIEPLSEPVMNKLNEYLREYYLVGGMPEAVQNWVDTKELGPLVNVQENIINAYYRDFSKYPPSAMVPKIVGIWDSIVPQLSRENRKFKYSEIKKSARAREYENALDWLIAGNYLNKVVLVDKLEMPLRGYENSRHFKIYLPDTGLLRMMADYPTASLLELEQKDNIPFKGAVAENYVLQELKALSIKGIYYWAKNNYEMDFAIQYGERVLPIEVKAGKNIKSKSMRKVLDNKDLAVRISMRNLKLDGKVLNIPLVLVSEIQRLLSIC